MDKIPLPTDNIYKFYALFGLLMLIFAFGARIAVNNDMTTAVRSAADSARMLLKENHGRKIEYLDERQLDTYQQTMKSAIARARTFRHLLTGLGCVGCVLLVFGFRQWHTKIQPIQDEMLELQLEKLRREVAALAPVPSPAVPGAVGESQAKGSPDQSPVAGT